MSDNENVISKKISVGDFKNWLSGIREFQPDNWVPNLDQWHKILDKIEDIEDSISTPPVSASGFNPQTDWGGTSNPNVQNAHTDHPKPVRQRPQAPLGDNGTVTLPDAPVRVVPKQVTVEKVGVPTRDEAGKVLNTGAVYKTGMIDTSKNDYESQFK